MQKYKYGLRLHRLNQRCLQAWSGFHYRAWAFSDETLPQDNRQIVIYYTKPFSHNLWAEFDTISETASSPWSLSDSTSYSIWCKAQREQLLYHCKARNISEIQRRHVISFSGARLDRVQLHNLCFPILPGSTGFALDIFPRHYSPRKALRSHLNLSGWPESTLYANHS